MYMGIVEVATNGTFTHPKVAYLKILYEEEKEASRWKKLDEKDRKARFPSRGLITWLQAPGEAKPGTVWFFEVARQKSTFVVARFFYSIEVVNVHHSNQREPRFFMNLARRVQVPHVPSKRLYLAIDENIWIGPVNFRFDDVSSVWTIDVKSNTASWAFSEALNCEIDVIDGWRFCVPSQDMLRDWKPTLHFDYETQASYAELKEMYFKEKGKVQRPLSRQAPDKRASTVLPVKNVTQEPVKVNVSLYQEPQNLEVKVHKVTSSVSACSQVEMLGLQNLGFGAEAINYKIESIQAEAIRAALWMHSLEGTTPVHINRFLRAAHRLMKPIWLYRKVSALDIADDGLDSETDPLDTHIFALHRPILSDLAQSGDVIKKFDHYWLPAQLYTKAFPDNRWRLKGGVPLYRLSEQVRQEIVFVRTERWLRREPGTVGDKKGKAIFSNVQI